MPLISIAIGALIIGLFLCFTRGGGMQQVVWMLRERRNRRRREQAMLQQRVAPLRAIKDPATAPSFSCSPSPSSAV